MPESKKVDKITDHGYMDLGYFRFMNYVGMKREWIPQPRATWVALLRKEKAINDDDKKLSKCSKQRVFTITKEIKNNLG
jgi:hypothetical protein